MSVVRMADFETDIMMTSFVSNNDTMTSLTDDYDYSTFIVDLDSLMTSWVDDRAFLPSIITYGLTFVCGILGNVMLIIKLTSPRRGSRRSVTSLFLLSLALSDLVFVFFCIPYDVISKTFSHWSAGAVTCKISTFVEMMCAEASVLSLTAVSVERHVVIVYPMKARRWCTSANYRRLVALVWLLAAILATPTLLLVESTSSRFYNNETHVVMVTCSEVGTSLRLIIAWYQVIVTFIIPTLLIGCCSAVVIRVLWTSTKSFHTLTNRRRMVNVKMKDVDGDSTALMTSPYHVTVRTDLRLVSGPNELSNVTATRKQVIKMLLTIVVVFLVCWGPKAVLNMMRRYSLHILHTDAAFHFMLVANLLPFVQSCVNPVVYGLMMQRSRVWLLSLLCHACTGRCRARKLSHVTQRGTSVASSTRRISVLTTTVAGLPSCRHSLHVTWSQIKAARHFKQRVSF